MTQPLRHMQWGGQVIRKQPPVRIRWCNVEDPHALEEECKAGGLGCQGPMQACDLCGFRYCQSHQEIHVSRVEWMPDSWRGTFKGIAKEAQKAGVTWYFGRHKPERLAELTRITWCKPRWTKHVDDPCSYANLGCEGNPEICEGCGFTYCPRHLAHQYHAALPRKYWLTLLKRHERNLDGIVKSGGRRRTGTWAPPMKV